MSRLRVNIEPHMTLSNVKTLTNLSEEQMLAVKRDLTYTNPEYVSAKRYSRYGNIRIPQYLTYYEKIPHGLIVPVGYDCTSVVFKSFYDFRTKSPCITPPFVLTLREDQKEAVEAYIRENTKPYTINGMIQMPTGKGKSICGLYLASYLKQRTLVIVHKTDLVRGWMKDAELAFNNKVTCGVYGNSKKKLGDFITIATVQTLNRLSDEEIDELKDYFGFVIIDEAHHCPASSYDLINLFSARYKCGLTATPERKDGLANLMTDFLGDFCYRYEMRDSEKDILPVDVYIKKPNVYFDPVCKAHRSPSGSVRYTIEDLQAPATYELSEDEKRLSEIPYMQSPKLQFSDVEKCLVSNDSYIKMVVQDMIKELKAKRSCIAFFKYKEHCSMYYYRLLKAGVPEELIQIYNGDCTPKQLEECLQRAENREALMTLTTYSKSTEGTNVKAWEVGFLVGSLNDGKSTEQAVGRIRRIGENKLKVAKLYDYDLFGVPMLSKHLETRIQRYQKLGFNIVENSRKLKNRMTRGYNRA